MKNSTLWIIRFLSIMAGASSWLLLRYLQANDFRLETGGILAFLLLFLYAFMLLILTFLNRGNRLLELKRGFLQGIDFLREGIDQLRGQYR